MFGTILYEKPAERSLKEGNFTFSFHHVNILKNLIMENMFLKIKQARQTAMDRSNVGKGLN